LRPQGAASFEKGAGGCFRFVEFNILPVSSPLSLSGWQRFSFVELPMSGIETFDPALFAPWPEAPAYDGLRQGGGGDAGWSEEEFRRRSATLPLETKSAEAPLEDLRILLNEMMREMREQFDHFRRLRAAADLLCAADADEAAAKLARADVKAATEGMSLIVRTLEKVDALQRQLARDRELEAERNADALGYEEKKRRLLDLIEQRANERVAAILEEQQRVAPVSDGAGLERGDGTGPPNGAGPPDGAGSAG
jgi:hypothetical protein